MAIKRLSYIDEHRKNNDELMCKWHFVNSQYF